MLIRHFMRRDVPVLNEDEPCRGVLRRFHQEGIQSAPVLREGKLVGLVTEKDLLRVLPQLIDERDAKGQKKAGLVRVAAVMTTKLVTVGADQHLEQAARMMTVHSVNALPVVDGDELVGMIATSEVLLEFMRMTHPRGGLRVVVESQPTVAVGKTEDPLDLVRDLDLRLRGLIVHPTPGGKDMTVLRVEGARAAELPSALTAAGWIVIDADGGALRESA